MTAVKTLTPKELAEAMGTDAKTLRKFLREWFATNELETPGQGGRYAITSADAKKIRKAFAAKATAPKETPAASTDEVIDEVEDFSDLEEPTDDEVEGDLEFEDIDEV